LADLAAETDEGLEGRRGFAEEVITRRLHCPPQPPSSIAGPPPDSVCGAASVGDGQLGACGNRLVKRSVLGGQEDCNFCRLPTKPLDAVLTEAAWEPSMSRGYVHWRTLFRDIELPQPGDVVRRRPVRRGRPKRSPRPGRPIGSTWDCAWTTRRGRAQRCSTSACDRTDAKVERAALAPDRASSELSAVAVARIRCPPALKRGWISAR
jgi:hypothetical protein